MKKNGVVKRNNMQIKINKILQKIKQFDKWLMGYIGFKDKDGEEIWCGDFCETFSRDGRRWTAFIDRRLFKMGNGKYKFCHVFASNYDTTIHDYWSKELKIIKSRKEKEKYNKNENK